MLARLQRVIVLGLLGLAALWAVHWWRRGEPVWALAGALLIVAIHVPVLALECVLLRWINRNDPAPPARLRDLLQAWAHESLAAVAVFGWRQPFRAHAEPDHLPPTAAGRRAAVLVHGFVCNRALWNPWMRRLRAQDLPFVAINLEPVFGSIERYATLIDAAVQRAIEATGQPPLIVAHSMGGLAVRAWLRSAPDADARCAGVVTIGTPHRGTWLARFGYARNAREMRLDGAWLAQLAPAEPAQRRARFTCFYSHCDNIVFPASTATLPGADNRHVAGAAHIQMVNREEVFQEVLRRLLEPAPVPLSSAQAAA